MSAYLLRLYISGKTPPAERALANVRRLCDDKFAGQYTVEVIDVLEQPQLAEEAKILATPTLVKVLPLPVRRVIGDLADTEKVLLGLDLHPAPAPMGSSFPS